MIGGDVSRLISLSLLVALYAGVVEAQQAPAGEIATPPATPIAKRPAELASNPANVICGEGNRLTITAENSTLRSILVAVQGCTGVPIAMPETAADERFYLQLGPGPAIDVLGALLATTDIDYVVLPAATARGKIEKVLLLARSKGASDAKDTTVAANHAMTPARRAWMASRNTGRAPAGSADGDEAKTEEGAGEAAEPAVSATAQTQVAEPTAAPAAADTPGATESGVTGSAGERPAAAPQPASADAGVSAVAAAAGSATGIADAAAKAAAQDAGAADAGQQLSSSGGAAAAAPDAGGDNSKPKDELENKITDMQKLFEQRKKLAGDAGPDHN